MGAKVGGEKTTKSNKTTDNAGILPLRLRHAGNAKNFTINFTHDNLCVAMAGGQEFGCS